MNLSFFVVVELLARSINKSLTIGLKGFVRTLRQYEDDSESNRNVLIYNYIIKVRLC